MSYVAIVEEMPREMQLPMLKVLDTLQSDMREQLAVRREDMENLQDAVKELTAAHKQSEVRLTRLETVVVELAEAQKRTELRVAELAEAQKGSEVRLTRLETSVAELVVAQNRTEQRVQELAEAQKHTQEQVRKMDDKMGKLVGSDLEARYRNKAYAYFGSLLRKTQVVDFQGLEPTLESALSDAEMEDVRLLDLLIRGQVARHQQRPDVILALEISAMVDQGDVERAVRRAGLLRRAGYPAIPAVAGDDVTEEAAKAAKIAHVLLMQDGRKEFWDEAVAAALAA